MHSDANIPSNRLRQAAALARYGTLVVLVVMFMGTHMPIDVSSRIVHSDKVMHFWAYMALGFGVVTTWDLSAGRLQGYQYLFVWLLCAVYGVTDELLQIPVGRSCEVMDWVFDIAGAAVGLAMFRVMRPIIYRIALLLPAPARI